MTKSNYIEIAFTDVEHLVGELILLVTATSIETKYTHLNLTPLDGYDKVIRIFEGNHTYYLGVFGKYRIAHVQCSMGSISRDSSIMTISTALQLLKAKIVVMVGIAFGVDDKKQSIGDVLVAESVIPYNSKRIGDLDTIPRGMECQSSQVLLNRFKNITGTWDHILGGDLKAKLLFTRVLSGEELIDNKAHRDKLISKYPESAGGEMEGAGLYSACGNKIDCILVKGICDFADGKKGKNKKLNQQIAITSSLSACLEIFNSPLAFTELGVTSIEEGTSTNTIPVMVSVNDVLFDFYDSSKEKYYIIRESDNLFNQLVKQFGIWIYGPSGCGKSNLIVRNLTISNIPFIQVNLAPCIGLDIVSFFKEILYELAAKVEGVNTQIQPTTFGECSKALISLLNKYYENKELIIFIEEIPVSSSNNSYKEFAEKIFSLVISKNFNPGLSKIKFVLSSIDDPTTNMPIVQHKIHQQMQFLPLTYWDTEIKVLIEMIIKEFNIVVPKDIQIDLIKSAKGSPRFIKKFFLSVYTLNKTDEKTLKMILKDTERDLSLSKYV